MDCTLNNPGSPNPWQRRPLDTCRNDLKTVVDYAGGESVWRHNTEEGDSAVRPVQSFLGRNGHATVIRLTKGSMVTA